MEKIVEKFVEIPETDGLFMISNKGMIVSFMSSNSRVIKPQIIRKKNTKQYLAASIKYKGRSIHTLKSIPRLVAESFLPNPDNHKYVICKDGDFKNVCVSNLEWLDKHKWNVENSVFSKKQFLNERN